MVDADSREFACVGRSARPLLADGSVGQHDFRHGPGRRSHRQPEGPRPCARPTQCGHRANRGRPRPTSTHHPVGGRPESAGRRGGRRAGRCRRRSCAGTRSLRPCCSGSRTHGDDPRHRRPSTTPRRLLPPLDHGQPGGRPVPQEQFVRHGEVAGVGQHRQQAGRDQEPCRPRPKSVYCFFRHFASRSAALATEL